ncbi:MAG: succinate dehydrogenase cytochrome b subunit [Bdellovibrionia bacterium]
MVGFLRSTIGKKYIMGVTGLIWAGFVLGHMAGNLLMFFSADAYNAYGHLLTSGNFIYVVEAVLISALLAHVFCAVSLTINNRKAKGSRYAATPAGEKKASLASKTMAVQGSVLLAFIIIHIASFKFGTYYETTVDGVVMRDLYRLVIESFQSPIYTMWYLVALVLMGFHLSHGVGSTFQSLGLMDRKNRHVFQKLSYAYAVIVAAGFISQPLYAFFFAN